MLINNIFSQKSVAILDFYKYALSNIFSNFRSQFFKVKFLCFYVSSSKFVRVYNSDLKSMYIRNKTDR